MVPIKNPGLFLDVAALTVAAIPKARFVMVGNGELREQLELQLKEKNLTGAVTLLGWQTDLFEFYKNVDVVIMTSTHEGTPLTLLEAMASGKPFVSTNVGGICDLVVGTPRSVDGIQIFDNGILTRCIPTQIMKGILYLCKNPRVAIEMGNTGRSFVSSVFTNDHVAEELDRFYLKLLKNRQVPTRNAIPT